MPLVAMMSASLLSPPQALAMPALSQPQPQATSSETTPSVATELRAFLRDHPMPRRERVESQEPTIWVMLDVDQDTRRVLIERRRTFWSAVNHGGTYLPALDALLRQYGPEIDRLEWISQLPPEDLGFTFDPISQAPPGELPYFRAMARLLRADAVLQWNRDKNGIAARRLAAILNLSGHLARQRNVGAAIVAGAMQTQALALLDEMLSAKVLRPFTFDDRVVLFKAIDSLDPEDPAGLRRAGERESQVMIAWLREHLDHPNGASRLDAFLRDNCMPAPERDQQVETSTERAVWMRAAAPHSYPDGRVLQLTRGDLSSGLARAQSLLDAMVADRTPGLSPQTRERCLAEFADDEASLIRLGVSAAGLHVMISVRERFAAIVTSLTQLDWPRDQ